MTVYDKLSEMRKEFKTHWAAAEEMSYWCERVFAEIAVAMEMSAGRNGKYDELVNKAVDTLYDCFTTRNALPDDICREAESIIAPLSPEAKKYTFLCVSHAHIDMDWLWGYHETVSVVTDTFRTMLDLMNEFPEFRFSQSQAATYEMVEKYDPDMFEEIRQRVKEGRWEFAGSTWVESDRTMPCGESFLRHVLYTKKYLNEKFDIPYEDIRMDFHPDSFGHAANMPEILTKAGIKYIYHCRGVDGRFLYRWRAPSGAEVLACNEPSWYNDRIVPESLFLTERFCREEKVDMMMKVFGVGDHGGGPTRRDVKRILDMATWPVAPTVRFGSYREFFDHIGEKWDQFPVYEEELGPTFTGCYTSQALLKQANRIGEDRLITAEGISAMSSICGGKGYNYGEYWRRILFNQFHDILPGSGIPETKDHALGTFEETLAGAGTGAKLAMRYFAANIDTSAVETPDAAPFMSVGAGAGDNISIKSRFRLPCPERGKGKTRIIHFFNPTSFDRDGVTEFVIYDWPANPKTLEVRDFNGNKVESSVLSYRFDLGSHAPTTVLADIHVPAFGYATYVVSSAERTDYIFEEFTPDPRITYYPETVLENDVVRVEFDPVTMKIVSFKDKTDDTEKVFTPSAFFSVADENTSYRAASAWVEGLYTKITDINSEFKTVLTSLSNSNLRSTLTYKISFMSSSLDVTVTLDKHSKVLRYSVVADWHETDGSPKLIFSVPFAADTDKYLYDTQYSVVERPECSVHDSVGRNFIAGGGMVLLTDRKYGYRGYEDSLNVSLLRSSTNPDRYPDLGIRRFEIGVGICDGETEKLLDLASQFINDLPYVSNTSHSGSLPTEKQFIECDGCTLSAVKQSEDGKAIIVRVFNGKDEPKDGKVRFLFDISDVSVCDITERNVSPLRNENGEINLSLKPNEVISLRIS